METLALFCFIFACYGFSNIVVYSSIFAPIRAFAGKISLKLQELLSCMMCFPMWAGMILSASNLYLIRSFAFTPMNMLFGDNIFDYYGAAGIILPIAIILIDGFISSGTTWVIHNIEEYFEKRK